jgi:hypothetical protein
VTFYHVVLEYLPDASEAIDLTPDRELSYRDARQVMIDFGRMFHTVLHADHARSYLAIMPVWGQR